MQYVVKLKTNALNPAFNYKFGVCLPDQNLIFIAKAWTLFLALECIRVFNCTKYVVYSDSSSCLQAVAGLKTDHSFVAKIVYKMDQLATDGYDIHVCWVPGHAGI